jgi:hypothetical protein
MTAKPNQTTVWVGLVLLYVTACGGDFATSFPEGIRPLETSMATRPVEAGTQRCPEVINVVQGKRPDYEFAHGRGCIHAPMTQVWNSLIAPEITVDRRRVSEFSTTRNVETGYEVSYRIHNIAHDLVTVEFDATYRGGTIEGTPQAPHAYSLVHAKTFGTSYIEMLRGSFVTRVLDANNTEIEFVRQIKATGVGSPEAELYLRDVFATLVARVHNRPLPTY